MILKQTLHCLTLVLTTLACVRYKQRENVRLSWGQPCDNKTIVVPHTGNNCVIECAEKGCKPVLFPVNHATNATWCCSIYTQEVIVTNGNEILMYDSTMTSQQCAIYLGKQRTF